MSDLKRAASGPVPLPTADSPVHSVPPGQILLVDDDPPILRLLEFELDQAGYSTVSAHNGAEAFELLAKEDIDVIVLDLRLPGVSGRDLLVQFREQWPAIPVIMLTAEESVEEIVECMRRGARDYVCKPFDRPRLLTSVANAQQEAQMNARISRLAAEKRSAEGFGRLIGRSSAMTKVRELLARAAQAEVTVLLTGDSGTGKEVAARALHAEGCRSGGPFVAVNCGAIPESLIESELFGHAKGSFTGAIADRPGYFEQSKGGTILLDEIGELPMPMQVRLLRVLQERQVQRIGDDRLRPVDVRVVAATNRHLAQMVQGGTFREDLYYRLAVFPIELPPLCDRGQDISLLAEALLEAHSQRTGAERLRISHEAREAMLCYPWPGNVRELQNALERACVLAEGDQIALADLPDVLVCAVLPDDPDPPLQEAARSGESAPPGEIRPLAEEERLLILRALEAVNGNMTQAARLLGIGRATIYRKIEGYGLQRAKGTHGQQRWA